MTFTPTETTVTPRLLHPPTGVRARLRLSQGPPPPPPQLCCSSCNPSRHLPPRSWREDARCLAAKRWGRAQPARRRRAPDCDSRWRWETAVLLSCAPASAFVKGCRAQAREARRTWHLPLPHSRTVSAPWGISQLTGFSRVFLQKIIWDPCLGFPHWKLDLQYWGRFLSVTPKIGARWDQGPCTCIWSSYCWLPILETIPVTQKLTVLVVSSVTDVVIILLLGCILTGKKCAQYNN